MCVNCKVAVDLTNSKEKSILMGFVLAISCHVQSTETRRVIRKNGREREPQRGWIAFSEDDVTDWIDMHVGSVSYELLGLDRSNQKNLIGCWLILFPIPSCTHRLVLQWFFSFLSLRTSVSNFWAGLVPRSFEETYNFRMQYVILYQLSYSLKFYIY